MRGLRTTADTKGTGVTDDESYWEQLWAEQHGALNPPGAVLAALTGATLAELSRLGHSTPAQAMRYQHAAQGRDQAIAEALSRIALGGT
jgi:hypothetical protein